MGIPILFRGSSSSAGINAALNVVEAGDTTAITTTLQIAGTVATQEAADAPAITGALAVQGAVATQEAADAPAITGALAVQGAVATQEAADAPAITGALAVQGAGVAGDVGFEPDIDEDPDTVSATAVVAIVGSASITEVDDAVSSEATLEASTLASPVSGGGPVLARRKLRIAPRSLPQQEFKPLLRMPIEARAEVVEDGDVVTATAEVTGRSRYARLREEHFLMEAA